MKKIIIFICVAVVIVGLIGFTVYNSIIRGGDQKEKVIATETVEETKTITEPQEAIHKDGKIIAQDGKEFDEEDLKKKIGIYLIFDNFMNDYYVPEQNNENANIVDYANEAKVFIGTYLVGENNPDSTDKITEEQVRKAIEEYCGEHYERFIDTAEYWMAFDGDNAYEYVQDGDYDPIGYCNSIESITAEDGKYTVTFIYSRPGDGTENQVPKYRKSMTFICHDDAKYTNYQLTELSFLPGEEIK